MALRFYRRNTDGTYTEETVGEMRARMTIATRFAPPVVEWWLTIAGQPRSCGGCGESIAKGETAAYRREGHEWRCQVCVDREGLVVVKSRKLRQRHG